MTAMDGFIKDDRRNGLFKVNQRAFFDPQIQADEQRLIFERTWLYAAHESEISEPGSFLSRRVAGRSIILTRASDGKLRAFFNACSHRGNEVCRVRSGTAKMLRCFYHSWAFDLTGDLVALPAPEAYGPAWNREDMGLRPVPRLDSYRGMIFVSFDPDIVPLQEYLGGAMEYIDLMLDFSDTENEIAAGEQNYAIKANWKLLVENSFDSYHGLPTHGRYFGKFLSDIQIDNSKWASLEEGGSMGGKSIVLGNGHALTQNPVRVTPLMVKSGQQMEELRDRLIQKYGKERAHRITGFTRNLLIFPNTIMIAYWRTIRTFYPVRPDYMEVNAWCLVPKDEPLEVRQSRLENFISFLGPAGFGTPDDLSALEGCQRGFQNTTGVSAWSDLSRGMTREGETDSTDELQMRSFWRRWKAAMDEEPGPVNCADRPLQPQAVEVS